MPSTVIAAVPDWMKKTSNMSAWWWAKAMALGGKRACEKLVSGGNSPWVMSACLVMLALWLTVVRGVWVRVVSFMWVKAAEQN